MKIKSLLAFFTILSIYSCSSDVDKIKKEIDINFDAKLSAKLKPVVASMPFYLYAVPENFWYPDGTTIKDIVNDEFKSGYKKLVQLDRIITQITSTRPDIDNSINTLHLKIVKQKQEIKKAQNSLSQVNSIFGFGLFGGATGMIDFATMLNGGKSDGSTLMPKELRKAFLSSKAIIDSSIKELYISTFLLESAAIGSRKIDIKQQIAIRAYLKKVIKNKFNELYTLKDSLERNEASQLLVDGYDIKFPLEPNNSSIKKDINTLSPLMKEGEFILPTYKKVISASIKVKPTITPDEFHGDTYTWALYNGITLSSTPSNKGAIDYISIECKGKEVINGLPYDLTFNESTLEECNSKFEEYHPQKELTYNDGNPNGYWLKFKKDQYWVYLSFNNSSFLYSIMIATFEIDQSS